MGQKKKKKIYIYHSFCFDMRVQRRHDAEGEPLSTVVGFLVLARGTYTLADGTLIEAGSIEVTRSGTSPGG